MPRSGFAGRHDDAFLPILTCRSCGQHFFEKHVLDLEFARGAGNRLRGFENGKATQDDEGQENAFWSPSPRLGSTGYLRITISRPGSYGIASTHPLVLPQCRTGSKSSPRLPSTSMA